MAHMQHVLVVAALANFQSIDSCVVWLVLYGCRKAAGVAIHRGRNALQTTSGNTTSKPQTVNGNAQTNWRIPKLKEAKMSDKVKKATAENLTDLMMRGGMPQASRDEQGKDARHNLKKAGGVFEKAGLNSPPQPSAVRSTTGSGRAKQLVLLAQTGSQAPSTSTKSQKLALGHGNDKNPGFDESRWHSAMLLLAKLSYLAFVHVRYTTCWPAAGAIAAGMLPADRSNHTHKNTQLE
jgi:hypothetical protein